MKFKDNPFTMYDLFITLMVLIASFIKKIFVFAVVVIFFVCMLVWFSQNAHAGIKAEIEMQSIIKVSNNKVDNVIFFGEIPNYYAIPEGFQVAAVGKFKTSPVTIKCDFELLLKLCKEKCKELNYYGYALTEFKRPSILNTCVESKVIFLIASD